MRKPAAPAARSTPRGPGAPGDKTGISELFQNDAVYLCLHDLDGNLVSVNDATCRALGYESADLLGRPIRELLAPERRGDFDDYLQRIRRSDAATGLMTVVTRSGERRFWHYQNTRDHGRGARSVVQGTAIDVTDLIQAERSAIRALQISEERYRLLFERSVAGIFRTTVDGEFLDCNDAFAKILRYGSRADLVSRNAADLYFFETDRIAFLNELREHQSLVSREICLRGRGEIPVWVVESATYVTGEGDRPAMIEGSILDISDRRQAEDALRTSEERYRFLFEANPFPMWVYEVDSLRFLDVNDAAVSHYGFSRTEFLSMKLPEIWPIEDRQRGVHPIAESALKSRPFEPSRHVRKDGTRIDVEVSAADIPGGAIRRRMALVRDVTEMRRAEKALIESEAKFRGIFDLAPIGIYQIAPGGEFVTANPAFARMLGYPPEELISEHNAYDLYFDPKERDDFISEFLAAPEKNSTERRLKTKSGKPVWVQITAQTIRDESGAIAYFEGFTHDISERIQTGEQQRRLQDAVLETARQWRDTFDAIETPVLVVDRDTIVRRLNRSAVALTGQTYVDVLGKPLETIASGELWRTAANLVRGGDDNSPARAGVLCRDEDSQTVWEIAVSIFRASEATGSPLWIVIARDVTAIVRLQESVHRAESMSSMGSLVAGVAHEVRNPLFAISATLDAFDLRFRERDDYKKYAEALRTQLDRMNALMRDLLDYGKPAVLEFRDVNAIELARDAVRGCADLAARKGVPVEIEPLADTPDIRVDRGRIIQVLLNLVENSVQHSPAGRPVTVKIEPAAPGARAGVRFTVEDRGAGFQTGDLPKLFEPFFTRRQGGTGLGLAIVRRIIEEHRGTIIPANRPEGGASMSVWLPRVPPDEPPPDPTEPKGRP